MVTRNHVIGVLGAVAIVLAGSGLAIVEPRSGPFTYEVAPGSEASLSGTYQVHPPDAAGTGSTVCEGPIADVACSQHATEVSLRLEEISRVLEPVGYAGFLVGEDNPTERLGVFEAGSDGFSLDASVPVDGDAFDALVVSVVEKAEPVLVEGLVVHRLELPDSGGEEVALDAGFVPAVGNVSGVVTMGQAGWFEVSMLADARLDGLNAVEGWVYRAWSIDQDAEETTGLGVVEQSGASGVLDARVARAVLEEQDAFVVTLEPEGVGAGEPVGFPVATVELST